jgi:hypothetical protein
VDPIIVINCRDRVTHLRKLVGWLERAGHERIVLLDNASTFPELLDFYERTPHEVVRLDRNAGSRAIWLSDRTPSEPFVYTDPDILPIDACPADAIAYLAELLDRFPRAQKAALGLYLDDVPETLDSLEWERSLVAGSKLCAPGVFDTLSDTTFALYRANAPFGLHALRTGWPYQARHMSWYSQEPLSAEDAYYLERATPGPFGSSWAQARER